MRTIVVTAKGETRAVPDQIFLDLAINSEAKTPVAAIDTIDSSLKGVLKIAASFGIEPQHVQTAQVQVAVATEYNGQKNVKTGFTATKSVTLCLKDISKFSTLLGALLEAGVTDVRGTRLTSSKADALRAESMLKAVANAKKQAETMAAVLGDTIDKAQAVAETGCGYQTEPVMSYASAAPAGAASGTGQAAGELAFTSSVTVTFSLK